jgi:hypothetical protein
MLIVGTKKENLEQADVIAKKTLRNNIYPGQHLLLSTIYLIDWE